MKHYLVALYKNTSHRDKGGNVLVSNRKGPGVKIGPMLWGLGFPIEILKEILKNFVPNRKG